MEWTDDAGNRRQLVYRLLPVPLMRFGGHWWCGDGWGRGVLVKTTTWHGEVWFERPDIALAKWREQWAQAIG